MKRHFLHKIGGLIIAVVFVVNLGLIVPRAAHAQMVVTDPSLLTRSVLQEVAANAKQAIKSALIGSISTMLINLVTQIANSAARDAAIWVASGGNADEPLFEVRAPKDYLQDMAMNVVAELYNKIDFENIDNGFLSTFNVYVPSDPELLQALRFGLRATVQSPIISSEYSSAKDNWEGYLAALQSSDVPAEEKTNAVLSVLSQGFDPRVNEISSGAQIQYSAVTQAQAESQVMLEDLLKNNGFTPVVDYITDNIETPASLVQSELRSKLESSGEISTKIALQTLGSTDTLLAVGTSVASVFSNTLLSEFLQNIQSGLFKDIAFDDANFDPFNEDSISTYSRSRIIDKYSSLSAFRPLQVTDYNLLSELSSCASTFRGSSRSLFSCAIDSSFASAVARANTGSPMTIQEAIDEGYIDGDWPLIPSSDGARNQDSKCYTYGFCHSNIVKLRKARIISIGWELAAESDSNSETNPVTLSEVIIGFNNCNRDNEIDDSHPWCHLIDPNWVFKFPETQCRTLAYGQLLSAANTDQRAEECVDIQSCITEDEDGNCTGGYGYCVREKNVWKFRGDECPEQYASCMAFVNANPHSTEEYSEVDYLTNTLDYGDCDESNLDCLWYSTVKEEGSDATFDWPSIPVVEVADEAAGAYKERIYFNGQVEECDEADGGCQQVIARDSDLSLNILANPSFETDADSSESPDSWLSINAEYDTENDEGRSGSAAINSGSSGVFYQYATLQQNRFYTLSAYAKQGSAAATATVAIFFGDADGNDLDVSAVSYTSGTCTQTGNSFQITTNPSNTDYERFDCTFTTPTLADSAEQIYAIIDIYGGDVWVDDVQLEQAEESSTFHYAYNNSSLSYEYYKIAPSYLGCTGGDDDPAECDDYAPMCSAQDAGCSLYTPVNGNPSVSAVVTELDQCPSVCTGYDTFRQEDTLYEPDGSFPIYFIPSTADECSEEAVGCDEFTNLTTEEKEYFTYLRACLTEDQADANTNNDNAAIFYTWEGSDEEGYQLKTWNLLESDVSGISYSPYFYAYSSISEEDIDASVAPCTNWYSTEDGIACDDDSTGSGVLDSDSEDCDQHSDILDNPDCREFYDTDGNIHYREWSKTVAVNNACVSYRKTDIVGKDSTAQNETCTNSGGYFDSANGFCRYYGYSEESTTCDSSESGCRKYTGGRSANSRVALRDTFEYGSLDNWDTSSATDVELSNESIATDGHSLKSDGKSVWTFLYEEVCSDSSGCASGTGTLGGKCTVTDGNSYCGTLESELFTNKTYTLSFWAKGDTDISVGFDINANNSSPSIEVDFGDVGLEADWQEYSLGPLDMNANDYPNFGEGTVLVFTPDSSSETFYIDNVVLREGEDDITVIKESWNTPAICDRNLEGETDDQYHLGCQEYTDQDGKTAYLKSFSSLCDEDKVGCDAFYKTNQSQSAFVSVYNATCYNIDSTGGSTWSTPDTATSTTTCYLLTSSDGATFDETSDALCTIISGENNCQFDMDSWSLPENVIESGSDFSQKTLYHIDYGPDATVVAADQDLYMIASSSYECTSAGAGCEELGRPTFSDDHSAIASWESVWLLNSPDDYADILCAHDELFCKAWDSNNEGTWYFKDPGGHVCEYKTDITIGSQTYDGWFQDGTSEFCYGTGYCAENEDVYCSTDADCAIEGAGTECVVNTGSYLVGGDLSGIWRNGDEDYTGWVGTCSGEYDGCTEYQDPLDFDDNEFYQTADGEQYFFLDNENLDENTLLSSQRCDGQVSQKEGCALFNDAGDTSLDYNASTTYITSVHADLFRGDEPFALVDPIDCSDEDAGKFTVNGEEVDLCARRCVYRNYDLDSSFDIFSITEDDFDQWASYGGSCYTDSDCPKYESDTGDLVSADCTEEVKWATGTGYNTVSDTPRLENDTNTILKVSRDRECSEWLACSSSYTIWDEGSGQYKTICDGVDLCTEYSAQGHPSFCSGWDAQDPAVVLDSEKYVSRDVTWYGEEYSGYSVPNIFPVQHLSQINTAPPAGFCNMENTDSSYHGVACESSLDCGGGTCVTEQSEEYSLGYIAGECDGAYATDCTIGYCDDNGAACASDENCDAGGDCVTGVCYEFTEDSCSSDDDCDSSEECLAGVCVSNNGYCDEGDVALEYTCDSGETCVPSEAVKDGSCFGGSCFLALDGNQFGDESSEGAVCRAQPEINSPFPVDIVKEWQYLKFGTEGDATESGKDAETKTTEDDLRLFSEGGSDENYIITTDDVIVGTDNVFGGTLPYSTVSGFGQASVCAPGETCECSYKKIANVGGTEQYIAYSSDVGNIGGICSADSPVAGAICGDDDDCRYYSETTETYTGTCEPINKVDKIIGLEGYCLERDTGLNINGDQYTGACLTWFPVDQIAGATDLYAKYKNAGYFEDAYYCSEVRTYSNQGALLGGSFDAKECQNFIDCPEEYWAIGELGKSSGSCVSMYICIPNDSFHTEGDDIGDKCSKLTGLSESNHGTEYDLDDYSEAEDEYGDCIRYGVSVENITDFDFTGGHYTVSEGYVAGSTDSIGLTLAWSVYPACDSVIKVSSEDGAEISAPWTNRLFNEASAYSIDAGNYTYDQTTESKPFGVGPDIDSSSELSYYFRQIFSDLGVSPSMDWELPAIIPSCTDGYGYSTLPIDGIGQETDCASRSGASPGFGNDGSYIQAREYLEWSVGYWNSTNLVTTDTITTVLSRLNALFAVVTDVFSWNADDSGKFTNGFYDTYSGSYEINYDATDVRATEGTPPTVWAVDTENCGSRYCAEGEEDALTLNNANDGTQESTDGFFRATLKFFAAANTNQLPIRRVIVDWGDGEQSGSEDSENYYKNHRGLQKDSEGVFSASVSKCDICTDDLDESWVTSEDSCEWGFTADSCDPNYFTYAHTYRCSDNDLDTGDACEYSGDNLTNSPCIEDDQCVYQPRVHVRDNWGWCTGSCPNVDTGTDSGSDECYDGDGTISTVGINDECDLDRPNDSRYTEDDPWVYYDGLIYVDP